MSDSSSNNSSAVQSRDTFMPESLQLSKITEMAETALLSSKELDERKIIYPGIDDYKTLNAYRELRTNLLTYSIKWIIIILFVWLLVYLNNLVLAMSV